MNEYGFASIEEALSDLKEGKMLIVVDDMGRENEGDLLMAAEMVTPEAINFTGSIPGIAQWVKDLVLL